MRGGSSRGSLAVVAMVMWKGKERERKREGNGERGDCRPERGVNDGQLQWRGRERQMVGMGEKTKG